MASTAGYAALDTRNGGGNAELEFAPLVLQGIPRSDAQHHSEVQLSSTGGGGEDKGEIPPIEWGGDERKEWKSPMCIITSVVIAAVIVIVCILIVIPRTNSQGMIHLDSTLNYRTAFHFQPHKNWMNDPNGLMYYMGYYHLFYQYNPDGPLWGNINWGHAVSRDLVHWHRINHSALAPGPDWYDINGVWSGSSTILPDGTPALLYTGWSNVSQVYQIQTQNLALPLNTSDPLLRDWIKSPSNPIMIPEKDFEGANFRDPTEGWVGSDGEWRILVGGRIPKQNAGTAHLYTSRSFMNWTYSHELHSVDGTGMWECPDFYPVSMEGSAGLEASANSQRMKHLLKMSGSSHDYYVLGTYDRVMDTFSPDDPALDLGLGLRYDYGKFYASKTFFDQATNRRILFGWINESDSQQDAVTKGWSGLQSLPRKIWLDPDTGENLIQAPVEEINGLHKDNVHMFNFTLTAGSIMPVDGVHGAQLDIQVEFSKPTMPMNLLFNGTDTDSLIAQEVCATNGTSQGGILGPFGLLVLAEKNLRELTAVFFYITLDSDGTWRALLCSDQSRSSKQDDVDKTTYGTYVRMLEKDQSLTLRTLVDNSIVESFAQGGRTVITARVYPTMALENNAYFYLFNNGTEDIEVLSFNAWTMDDALPDDLE